MNVVLVGSEAVPFSKTGGLADVLGALPSALRELAVRMTLVVPLHRETRRDELDLRQTGWSFSIPIGETVAFVRVWVSSLPGADVPVYLVDHPASFDRDGLYQHEGRDYEDNAARYILFMRAAIEIIQRLPERPDLIHCNDWQTALIPIYLAEHAPYREHLGGVGTLLTIHNLSYQGRFPASEMALTGLDSALFNERQLAFAGQLNFLKAGIVSADMLSTVSPTYAKEIQTPPFGNKLYALLRARPNDLWGILNGIDVDQWSPSTEPMLACNYDLDTYRAGKALCKAALQRHASLPERPDIPLFAQVGRFDPQKGWDLLIATADDLLRDDVQMVVLGSGDPIYQDRLERLADEHPGKLRAFFGFDEPLAHQIEAGADLFLMPSLFEPCGLNQLYSMIHGTVPVVRTTGGLADTVVEATPRSIMDGIGTGFVFEELTPDGFRAAINRALALWEDQEAWGRLVVNGMRGDWSWQRSARGYVALYDEVVRRAGSRARAAPPTQAGRSRVV